MGVIVAAVNFLPDSIVCTKSGELSRGVSGLPSAPILITQGLALVTLALSVLSYQQLDNHRQAWASLLSKISLSVQIPRYQLCFSKTRNLFQREESPCKAQATLRFQASGGVNPGQGRGRERWGGRRRDVPSSCRLQFGPRSLHL